MLKSIECLRVFAALAVLCAHLPQTEKSLLAPVLGSKFFCGAIGVDIFFVISGLVMGLSIHRKCQSSGPPINPLNFLWARILRIYPLYIFSALAALALVAVGLKRYDFTLGGFLRDISLYPYIKDGVYQDPIIPAGWTLRYELFFYFTAFIGLSAKNVLAPILILASAIARFPVDIGYFSNPILFEFLGGYILAITINKQCAFTQQAPIQQTARYWLLAASILIVIAASTGKDFTEGLTEYQSIPRMIIYWNHFSLPRYIAWGLPALLFVAASVGLESKASSRIAKLGKYTYSFYILQYFFVPVQSKLLAITASYNASALIMVGLLCAASYYSYSKIESSFFPKLKKQVQ